MAKSTVPRLMPCFKARVGYCALAEYVVAKSPWARIIDGLAFAFDLTICAVGGLTIAALALVLLCQVAP